MQIDNNIDNTFVNSILSLSTLARFTISNLFEKILYKRLSFIKDFALIFDL